MIGSFKFRIVSGNLNLLKSVHKPTNAHTRHFGAQTQALRSSWLADMGRSQRYVDKCSAGLWLLTLEQAQGQQLYRTRLHMATGSKVM
jgi:hypothetical protein